MTLSSRKLVVIRQDRDDAQGCIARILRRYISRLKLRSIVRSSLLMPSPARCIALRSRQRRRLSFLACCRHAYSRGLGAWPRCAAGRSRTGHAIIIPAASILSRFQRPPKRSSRAHPRSRRAARRTSQAGTGRAPGPHADRALQRPGEAAGRRGADREGARHPRARAGLGHEAPARADRCRRVRRLRLAAGSADEEILARLVELNKERRAEEAKGLVRWLRPEYQAPAAKRIVVERAGPARHHSRALGRQGRSARRRGRRRCPSGSPRSAACWRSSPGPRISRSWRAVSSAPRATTCRRS